MKTKPVSDPEPVFTDPNHAPKPGEVRAALGAAAAHVDDLLARIREFAPAMTMSWHYYRRAGWYQTYSLKDRRLVYIGEKRDGVCVSLLLGDKAIAAMSHGPHAAQMAKLLPQAKRFPEGTGFYFYRGKFNPKLVAAMIAAKLGKSEGGRDENSRN